jgi:hypothetical protein
MSSGAALGWWTPWHWELLGAWQHIHPDTVPQLPSCMQNHHCNATPPALLVEGQLANCPPQVTVTYFAV